MALLLAGRLQRTGAGARNQRRRTSACLEKLLAGDFANKAPTALVQKEREKLEGYRKTAEKIEGQL